MKEEQESNSEMFTTPPIISEGKLSTLIARTISTVFGAGAVESLGFESKQIQFKIVIEIILYLAIPVLTFVPAISLNPEKNNNHIASVLISVLGSLLFVCIYTFLSEMSVKNKIYKIFITILYTFLWSVHFCAIEKTKYNGIISENLYNMIVVTSCITLWTSASTVFFTPVREFSSGSYMYEEPHWHSTAYVRFYVLAPILFTEMIMFYLVFTEKQTEYQEILWYLSAVSGFGFILWFFGWISTLYNTCTFVVSTLLNSVVFGEEHEVPAHLTYIKETWWTHYLKFLLNFMAIGVNIALFSPEFRPSPQQTQSQHLLLVCLSTGTTLVTYLTVLGFFALTSKKDFKIRKIFLNFKNLINLFTLLIVPLIVCLLVVFGFAQIYGGYSTGQNYQKNNYKTEKLTTWIVLLINSIIYFITFLFMQMSKDINLGSYCFHEKYMRKYVIISILKNLLKISGALSVMVLTLRLQNLEITSKFILNVTPIEPVNERVHFFVQHILIPILIYRSYKRAQYFSHIFHITIFISFVLTVVDSSKYFYESIFIVLAMGFIGRNIFFTLLVSPFTTPKKLIHSNELFRRVIYFTFNILCMIVYIGTLGTLELTMFLGMPMFFCVMPSSNSYQPIHKKDKNKILSENSSKVFPHNENPLNFGISEEILSVNSSQSKDNEILMTPEHAIYEKICEELECPLLSELPPSTYLLRVDKYILLLEKNSIVCGWVGLEAQETTSCHSKEGEVLDRLAEKIWKKEEQNTGSDPIDQEPTTSFTLWDRLGCVEPILQMKNIEITAENELQMTGILESEEFFTLYKQSVIKSVLFMYNKMLLKQNGQLTKRQKQDAHELFADLQGRVSKEKIDEIFPYDFMEIEDENANKKHFCFGVKFQEYSNSKIIKKKLPPITKKEAAKKEKALEDWGDLLDNSNTFHPIVPKKEPEDLPEVKEAKENVQIIPEPPQPQISEEELHMSVVYSLYEHVIGKMQYFSAERVMKLFRNQIDFNFSQSNTKEMNKNDNENDNSQQNYTLIHEILGCALKVALTNHLNSENEISLEDLKNYSKNEYLGIQESTLFAKALQENRMEIWTCCYNSMKKVMQFKRIAKNTVDAYVFSIDPIVVSSIWNNLRYELLFATNDSDERYSIQTHEVYMRNLLIEAAELPFGYAGYYGNVRLL